MVSGTVRDQDRQPVFGASVCVWACVGNTCFYTSDTRTSTTTDAAGHYSVTVSPGSYRVDAERACYVDTLWSQLVNVPPNAIIDITLHRITNRISGRVTDSSGAPVI